MDKKIYKLNLDELKKDQLYMLSIENTNKCNDKKNIYCYIYNKKIVKNTCLHPLYDFSKKEISLAFINRQINKKDYNTTLYTDERLTINGLNRK